jgi:hypothetical protein
MLHHAGRQSRSQPRLRIARLLDSAMVRACALLVARICVFAYTLSDLLCNRFNPFVEEQAIARVDRLGQDKPVVVYRLIMAGTIEESLMAMQVCARVCSVLTKALLQEKKRKLVQTAGLQVCAVCLCVCSVCLTRIPTDARARSVAGHHTATGRCNAGSCARAGVGACLCLCVPCVYAHTLPHSSPPPHPHPLNTARATHRRAAGGAPTSRDCARQATAQRGCGAQRHVNETQCVGCVCHTAHALRIFITSQ